jgi:allophanate hydrolase
MSSQTKSMPLDISCLREAFASSAVTPTEVVEDVYSRIESYGLHPVWIHLVSKADAVARAKSLESSIDARKLPLYGVPFAVKDNIDVAGIPTTAGCPAYAYTPSRTAFAVQKLLDAGAILIGKTNLDQFATGLVGVRSPYGACSSVFDDDYISGGSSSGSAVAVARGLVSFSLGTDTAGSGRVPAAFNNLIGLKPTRGLLSTAGVVPACRTLDCVSIFALTCSDAHAVLQSAGTFDSADPYSRPKPYTGPVGFSSARFRFGVPPSSALEFFGDDAAASLYAEAVETLSALGGEKVEIDYEPFRAAASLLYSGPWVAERLAAIRTFANDHADDMHPVVRQIITGASRFSALDAFSNAYLLADLKRLADAQMAHIDFLMLPTTGTIYTKDAIEKDPIGLNTNLGYYTNFVNLLDLSAVAVPAGFRDNGLPFGITLIGPAFADKALLGIADRFHRAKSETIGAHLNQLSASPAISSPECPDGYVPIAVVGAHLTGQPLNYQLTERNSYLMKTCLTASGYRFYALSNTTPPKPGLARVPGFDGPGIELEVWAMPQVHFGSFVAAIPPPLSIGTVELADGTNVKCFLCEPFALEAATEITAFGGWRGYLKG